MASTEKSMRKDKNQNIQVFVRLRPINQRERAIRSLGVVEVVNNREVVVRQSQQTSHTKKFTFDRAFGPNVQQVEVYKEVVSPLIAEVLAGYNCTVFAYGQTGTGKTHTMVGESTGEGSTWQSDPLAGIIPRALSQLFDELRISNGEYTVRVSYLELYNEELFDLLSSSDDNSKLRIYEDVTRKGSTIVNGLEEITVYNKNEVYEIMAQGQERKKVASTLMNAQSSRSHTVFTIVVHMKENCPKGEELVKIGKLNLVDLAGSENISKAGSDNPAKRERARECVNINQSLLTLGRVITALVEKHPHIPYRESKLTRILQESLGGRTKTSIIATISPGHKDLEETMSTLEYAHRAKNIQNKPEVNQKLTKQAILKEFAEEVDKLKRELTAAREKNGVYLPSETYEEMTLKHDEQRREIQDLLLKKRAMEEERERMHAVFQEMETSAARVRDELSSARQQLDVTTAELSSRVQRCVEQEHLVQRHRLTETELTAQAQRLIAAADCAAGDAARLHDAVDKRRSLESANRELLSEFREESAAQRARMAQGVQHRAQHFAAARDQLQAAIDDNARDTSMAQEMNIQDMNLLVAKMAMFMSEMKTVATESSSQFAVASEQCLGSVEAAAEARRGALQTALGQLVHSVAACLQRAEDANVTGTVARSTSQWLSDASARVSCLQRSHASYSGAASAHEARRQEAARRHHRDRLDRLAAREGAISACIQEIEKDKKAIEERMTQQLAVIEAEREETELRLHDWMEQERRSLEERMARHVEIERNALNARIERHMAELALQRTMYEESTARCMELQQLQLKVSEEEAQTAEQYLQSCEQDVKESLKNVEEFAKKFGDGTSAITAEMEAFSHSVVQIVAHTNDRLLADLGQARDHIQQAAEEVTTADLASSKQCAESTSAAVATVVHTAGDALSAALQKTQENTTTAVEALTAVKERSSALAQSALAQQATTTAALASASDAVHQLDDTLQRQLDDHDQLEGRYLMQEYRVYSPSGATPLRREYRYPRRLAATSPHARILQRLRQRPLHGHLDSPDSDYIVLESDEGRQTSDSDEVSESSVSEDSAVAMQ